LVCTHTLGGTASSTCKIYITDSSTQHTAAKSVSASEAGTYEAMENTTQPFAIGGRSGASATFNGLIDDARVYNTELGLAEIKKNWRHGSSKHKD
jgi:hypothetical protein